MFSHSKTAVKKYDEQFNDNCVFFLLHSQDAKLAKPEVNLMSLLSSFDDISLLPPEDEETDSNKDRGEAPKLPRTNSLEDLGIKVTLCFCPLTEVILDIIHIHKKIIYFASCLCSGCCTVLVTQKGRNERGS